MKPNKIPRLRPHNQTHVCMGCGLNYPCKFKDEPQVTKISDTKRTGKKHTCDNFCMFCDRTSKGVLPMRDRVDILLMRYQLAHP